MCQFIIRKPEMSAIFNEQTMELQIVQDNSITSINTVADVKAVVERLNNPAYVAILALAIELNHAMKSDTQWYYDFNDEVCFMRRLYERLDYLISFKFQDFEYVQEILKLRNSIDSEDSIEEIIDGIFLYGVRLYNGIAQAEFESTFDEDQIEEEPVLSLNQKHEVVEKSSGLLRTHKSKLVAIQTIVILILLAVFLYPQKFF